MPDLPEVNNELTVRNPYSGEELGRIPFAGPDRIASALQRSREAFSRWRQSSSFERSQLLGEVARALESRKDEFAQLISREAGKPIRLAEGEVERALGVLRWAAAEAVRFSGELLRLDTAATGRPGFGIHNRFPRGVILGITPFNFPLNLVLHKVAPAVACGCTIVIKPSPATPLTALKLAELFEALAPGVVQVVIADDQASAALTQAREVAMISFTGSSRVGWAIRRQAPEKVTALELGGNAWCVVMADTPQDALPAIARRIAGAAFGYAGQSCISVQNVAVAASLHSEMRALLESQTRETAYGDPASRSVVSGPVINLPAAERIRLLLDQLPTSISRTSSSRVEGGRDSGTLIPPSLLCMPAEKNLEPLSVMDEEVFAPIMTLTAFDEVPRLIVRINAGRYGLQAGVFTQNWATIEKFYQELEVGGVVINDVPTTRHDHQPYGGVKESGQGREGLRYAMEEMSESKFLALSSRIPL